MSYIPEDVSETTVWLRESQGLENATFDFTSWSTTVAKNTISQTTDTNRGRHSRGDGGIVFDLLGMNGRTKADR